MTPRLYLTRDELPEAISLSRNTIDTEIRQGRFPRPRQLSGRRVAWLMREVTEWAESRPVADLLPPPAGRQPEPQAADQAQ